MLNWYSIIALARSNTSGWLRYLPIKYSRSFFLIQRMQTILLVVKVCANYFISFSCASLSLALSLSRSISQGFLTRPSGFNSSAGFFSCMLIR